MELLLEWAGYRLVGQRYGQSITWVSEERSTDALGASRWVHVGSSSEERNPVIDSLVDSLLSKSVKIPGYTKD